MRQLKHIFTLLALAMLVSCGADDLGSPGAADDLFVSGEVTSIENEIAADGGITLDVDVLDNGKDRLIFPSLFTYPPPSEEVMQLYDVVRRVEVGDIVRAEGVRLEHDLLIENLWILDGRP